MRKTAFAVGGWLLVAALAVVTGTLAVSLLGSGITGQQTQPLSKDAVVRALAKASTPSQATRTAGRTAGHGTTITPEQSSSEPGPRTRTRSLSSTGGSVVVRCTGAMAYLRSWSPRQGFESDEQDRGPARTVSVQFESDDLDELVTVTCENGAPVSHVTHDD
ncbi:MAG: hypothetical protein ACRDQA_03945 [Nocardioidaceae bacterium]